MESPSQGLTVEEANRALQEDFQKKYESATVTVSFNKKEYSLSIYPVLELDSASVVAEAYSLGHGFWFAHGTDRIQLMNSSGKEEHKVMPTAVNVDKLEEALEESGLLQAGTTVDTSCRLTDKELIITKGKTGIGRMWMELKKEILNAISEENYNASIECPVMEVKPDDFDMEAYYEEVHTEAQDASLGKNSEIIPAVTGISFNVKTAARKLAQAKEGEVISISLKITQPEVSTEELEALPYLNLLGTYTTYGGGTKNGSQI